MKRGLSPALLSAPAAGRPQHPGSLLDVWNLLPTGDTLCGDLHCNQISRRLALPSRCGEQSSIQGTKGGRLSLWLVREPEFLEVMSD